VNLGGTLRENSKSSGVVISQGTSAARFQSGLRSKPITGERPHRLRFGILIGTPIEVIGTPIEVIGTPTEVIGTPIEVIGTPIEVIGTVIQSLGHVSASSSSETAGGGYGSSAAGAGSLLVHFPSPPSLSGAVFGGPARHLFSAGTWGVGRVPGGDPTDGSRAAFFSPFFTRAERKRRVKRGVSRALSHEVGPNARQRLLDL
jgi:hypothetical protein